MVAPAQEASQVFIELGAAIVALALLARLASRLGFSAIPLYLLLGLAFGNGGITPLNVSEHFINTGAEIGVLLLLFMLGLEYTGEELKRYLRTGLASGVLPLAVTLGLISALTKVLTGYWAAGWAGVDRRARIRAGMTLVARCEFSIVIAGFGAGLSPELGPVAADYVLFLAVLGPLLARASR